MYFWINRYLFRIYQLIYTKRPTKNTNIYVVLDLIRVWQGSEPIGNQLMLTLLILKNNHVRRLPLVRLAIVLRLLSSLGSQRQFTHSFFGSIYKIISISCRWGCGKFCHLWMRLWCTPLESLLWKVPLDFF